MSAALLTAQFRYRRRCRRCSFTDSCLCRPLSSSSVSTRTASSRGLVFCHCCVEFVPLTATQQRAALAASTYVCLLVRSLVALIVVIAANKPGAAGPRRPALDRDGLPVRATSTPRRRGPIDLVVVVDTQFVGARLETGDPLYSEFDAETQTYKIKTYKV